MEQLLVAGTGRLLVVETEQLEVVARIRREHAAGLSMRTIAQRLTDDGVPTATGSSRWSHSTVQRVLQRPADEAAGVCVNEVAPTV